MQTCPIPLPITKSDPYQLVDAAGAHVADLCTSEAATYIQNLLNRPPSTQTYRIIVVSNESGTAEGVCFTQDTETPASDFCRDDETVDIDEERALDLPGAFPTDYMLYRD